MTIRQLLEQYDMHQTWIENHQDEQLEIRKQLSKLYLEELSSWVSKQPAMVNLVSERRGGHPDNPLDHTALLKELDFQLNRHSDGEWQDVSVIYGSNVMTLSSVRFPETQTCAYHVQEWGKQNDA